MNVFSRVHHTLVEDETVLFRTRPFSCFHAFGGWMTYKEMWVDDIDVPSFAIVQRVEDLFQYIPPHDACF